MGTLLKDVKVGDKVVYANCKLNRQCAKEHNIVVGKIYTVQEDFAGDLYVKGSEDDFRCYAGLWDGWADSGKPTKIID